MHAAPQENVSYFSGGLDIGFQSDAVAAGFYRCTRTAYKSGCMYGGCKRTVWVRVCNSVGCIFHFLYGLLA